MKKITLLFILVLSLNASAQITNAVLPAQVKTSANGGGDVNTYTVTFDYTFADETDLNKMQSINIRIRPITAPEVKDQAAANTDLFLPLPDFKTYVLANGFTGSYSVNLNMPEDAALATSASRDAANPGYGYDTRVQWGYNATFPALPFVAIEVLDSSGTCGSTESTVSPQFLDISSGIDSPVLLLTLSFNLPICSSDQTKSIEPSGFSPLGKHTAPKVLISVSNCSNSACA